MDGGDDRHLEFAEHQEEVFTRFTAKDAVLMLKEHTIDAGVVEGGREAPVVGWAILLYSPPNLGWIVVDAVLVVQSDDSKFDIGVLARQFGTQVIGKRCDPALARNVAPDDRDALQRWQAALRHQISSKVRSERLLRAQLCAVRCPAAVVGHRKGDGYEPVLLLLGTPKMRCAVLLGALFAQRDPAVTETRV